MSFLDKLKGQTDGLRKHAAEAVDKHGDKIGHGLDKAKGFVDDKTGGKHADKTSSAVDKAKAALDKLDDKNDDIK